MKGVVEDVKGKVKEAAGCWPTRRICAGKGKPNRTRLSHNAKLQPRKPKQIRREPRQKLMRPVSAAIRADCNGCRSEFSPAQARSSRNDSDRELSHGHLAYFTKVGADSNDFEDGPEESAAALGARQLKSPSIEVPVALTVGCARATVGHMTKAVSHHPVQTAGRSSSLAGPWTPGGMTGHRLEINGTECAPRDLTRNLRIKSPRRGSPWSSAESVTCDEIQP